MKATKQMHDTQGCLILAAYIKSPSSDSNYDRLKSLLHPIPGFSNLSKTQINLKGSHRNFQNLPTASGILPVWAKFLGSTWISVFFVIIALLFLRYPHHTIGTATQYSPITDALSQRRRLGSGWHKERQWGEKRALPFLKGCTFRIHFYHFLETISFTKDKCFPISKTK